MLTLMWASGARVPGLPNEKLGSRQFGVLTEGRSLSSVLLLEAVGM